MLFKLFFLAAFASFLTIASAAPVSSSQDPGPSSSSGPIQHVARGSVHEPASGSAPEAAALEIPSDKTIYLSSYDQKSDGYSDLVQHLPASFEKLPAAELSTRLEGIAPKSKMLFGARSKYNTLPGKSVDTSVDVDRIRFMKVEEAGNKYHPGYFVVSLMSRSTEFALVRGVSPPQPLDQFYEALNSEKDRLEKQRKKKAKAQAPPSALSRAATKFSSALCRGSPC